MAIASTRSIQTTMSGDLQFSRADEAASNATGPGVIEKKTLAQGNNTITAPSGAKGVTFKPPTGNAQTITLKGVNGDTGIALHKTDPTSLGLDSVSSFVLNAGDTVTGMVFVWT